MEVILTRIVNRSEDGLLTTSTEFSPSLPTTNRRSPCYAATPWGHSTGVFNFEQTNSYQVPTLKSKLGGHLESHFALPKRDIRSADWLSLVQPCVLHHGPKIAPRRSSFPPAP